MIKFAAILVLFGKLALAKLITFAQRSKYRGQTLKYWLTFIYFTMRWCEMLSTNGDFCYMVSRMSRKHFRVVQIFSWQTRSGVSRAEKQTKIGFDLLKGFMQQKCWCSRMNGIAPGRVHSNHHHSAPEPSPSCKLREVRLRYANSELKLP
jgi:hypothetical protein